MSIKPDATGDKSKFKTRLGILMVRKGYNNANDLARALYEHNLVSVKSKRSDITLEEEIKKNAIGSIVKKVRRHMTSDTVSSVQGEFIDAYCKLFECSSDYLMGYTDVISQDLQIPDICKKLQLSEGTVLRLSDTKLQPGLSEMISYMLEDGMWAPAFADYWPNLLSCAVDQSYSHAHLDAIDKVLEEHKSEDSFTLENIKIQRKSIEKLNVSNNDRYDSKIYTLSTYIRRSFEDAFLKKFNEVDWYQKAYDEAYKKYKTMAELNEDTEKEFEFHEHNLNDIIQNKENFENT